MPRITKLLQALERCLGVKYEEARAAIEVLEAPGMKALLAPSVSTILSTIPVQRALQVEGL